MKGKQSKKLRKDKLLGKYSWLSLAISLIVFSFLLIYYMGIPVTTSYFTDSITSEPQEVDFNSTQ